MSNSIVYLKGDATSPQAEGPKLIVHICNDLGGWGAGFVLAVSRRWPEPEAAYRAWHEDRERNDFGLGAIQRVQVSAETHVVNMIAQEGIAADSEGRPPIRYEAVEQCLDKVGVEAEMLAASVHMPRIGCGLAGGKWERIEPLITTTLLDRGLSVVVYDFD